MNVLRLVKAADTQAVKRLWQYCFDDSEEFVQWYFDHYYQPENTLGVYDGERLMAATQIIPYTISLRRTPMSVGYVVGVSTAPEARRQGLGKQMLIGALQKMRARQQYLSLLMPFEGGFYYGYGWEFSYFRQKVVVNLAELRRPAISYGRLCVVEISEASEYLMAFKNVYEQFCAMRNGYVLRRDADWQRIFSDATLEKAYGCLLYGTGDQLEGYAFYTFDGEDIRILEMAYSDYQARGGLLDFFYGHRSHCRQLIWLAPVDDRLIYELEKSKEAIRLYPYLMVRVVDAEGVLSSLSYEGHCLPLKWRITDDIAPWNDGCYRFTVVNGRGIAEKVQEEQWDIAMDIGALGLLVTGSVSVHTLWQQGLIKCASESLPKQWAALWPQENNYISEDY